MTTNLPKPLIDRKPKLNEIQKQYVVKSLAHFIPITEILANLKKEFGITCSNENIFLNYKNNPKYKDIMNKERQVFLSEIAEVPGAHKRVRLDRGERIYNYAIDHEDMRMALEAIKYQKDELEEKLGGGNTLILQLNQFNQLTDVELEERRQQLLERVRTIEGKKVETIEFKGEDHGHEQVA